MSDRKSRVFLINPPYPSDWKPEPTESLGLGYISSYLTSKGFETKIHNMTVDPSKKSLQKAVYDFDAEFVGLSIPFTKCLPHAMFIAQWVKETDYTITIVAGGIHPSYHPMFIEGMRDITYAVKGEGEMALHDILTNPTKLIVEHPIDDLDSLPFPHRTYINPNRVGVVTSRGCPFDCSFCSVHSIWGYKWRGRSPSNVVDEIQILNRSVKYITFEDDNLTFDRDRAIGLFELMEHKCNVNWSTPNGIFMGSLDKELLTLMKRSGCYALNLPIESANDLIRNDVIGKKITKDKIREIVKACKELDILTLGYFVIGMPGENLVTMNESLEFAKELLLDAVNVFIATPYPGSKLFKECNEKGWFITDDLEKFGAFNAVFQTPWLKAKEVDKFRLRFQTEFNKYHDSHSSITTEKKRNRIRRPLC